MKKLIIPAVLCMCFAFSGVQTQTTSGKAYRTQQRIERRESALNAKAERKARRNGTYDESEYQRRRDAEAQRQTRDQARRQERTDSRSRRTERQATYTTPDGVVRHRLESAR